MSVIISNLYLKFDSLALPEGLLLNESFCVFLGYNDEILRFPLLEVSGT